MKNLVNKIPSYVQKQIEEKLEQELLKRFAKVDPQTLKEYANIVGRKLEEVQDTKDTEDYNMDQISEIIDWSMKVYMDAGQKKLKPGDGVKIEGAHSFMLGVNKEYAEAEEAMKTGDYNKFPFSMAIASELRTKFLLQTEKDDNFKDLMYDVENNILNYTTKKTWNILKKAMNNSKERIFNEDLEFLAPMSGLEQGNVRELTDKEMEKYKIKYFKKIDKDGNETGKEVRAKIDVRKDNFDMVALKDLSLILSGKKEFEYMSVAPGFFAKFMPEIKELGYDAVIFKVHNETNKLEEISITSLFGRDTYQLQIHYSPMRAAICVTQKYAAKGVKDPEFRPYFKDVNLKFMSDKSGDYRYYIVVDGTVAAQDKNETILEYEGSAFNHKRVKAGEVFLLEKRPEIAKIKDKMGVMFTRLYFTPYKPTELHPYYQHGGVVFGSNDQSLHSCWDMSGDRLPLRALNNYKAYWHSTMNRESLPDEAWGPAVTAARLHFLEDKERLVSQLFTEEKYDKVLHDTAMSLYEISRFTMTRVRTLLVNLYPYNHIGFRLLVGLVTSFYAPLSKRMLLKEYVETGKCSYKVQPAWYDEAGRKSKEDALIKFFVESNKLDRIDSLRKEGLTLEEAKKKTEEEFKHVDVKEKFGDS